MEKVIFKKEKDFDDYKDYINNKDKVLNVLKDLKFTIKKEATTDNYNYSIYVSRNKKTFKFHYFEGFGHEQLTSENKFEKIISFLYCVLSDYNYIIDDYTDFCEELGYEENAESKTIYKNILKNNERILKLFNTDELAILLNNINL